MSVKRKKLGQHFLIDNSVTDMIVREAKLKPGDKVVEIGPGRGILTGALLNAGVLVYAVEIDWGLYEGLQEEYGSNENFSVVRANALKHDFAEAGASFHIVSNLPYSVSTPLVKRFIEMGANVKSMTLMMQEEVGKRMTADAGDSSYGSLSLYVSFHCATTYLFKVPPTAFRPPPKVDSAVIRLVPREKPPVSVGDEDRFFEFIRKAFAHRRKTLSNNVKDLFGGRESFSEVCASANLDPRSRPEQATLESYASLFAQVENENENTDR